MKKTVLKIILIIIAVLLVVGIAFGIILHKNKINVSNAMKIQVESRCILRNRFNEDPEQLLKIIMESPYTCSLLTFLSLNSYPLIFFLTHYFFLL